MLKRCKKILLIVLGVLLISGCKAKSETSMIINDDMSINIKGIIGYDDEIINAMMSMSESSFEEVKNYTDEEQRKYLEENFIDTNEAFSSMKNQGFTVQEYQDETYMGYVMSKNIKNIDDFVGDNLDLSISDYEDFNNKKMFKKEGNVYKGRILFNKSETTTEIETYDIELDYKFILTLPNKAISSNATSVSDDGKTLTWDLANTNIDAIEFEFEFPSFLTMLKNNMFVVAGIAILVILIIVLIAFLIIYKLKKKKNINNGNSSINVSDKNQAIQNMLPIEEPTVNVQSKVQIPVMSEPMVNVKPEVQAPVMNEPMVDVQPEVQTSMMSEPMVNVQPEVQAPVMSEPMVNVQPEVQTPVMSEPMVNVQPEVQTPVMSEPMVNVKPEVQASVMSEPMVNVQPEVQTPMMSEPMVNVQPEVQAPVMSEPMVNVLPEVQMPVMSEPMVNVQPEVQTPVMSEPMVNVQPEVQAPMMSEPVMNVQQKVGEATTSQYLSSDQKIELSNNMNFNLSNQDTEAKPLFPQDIIPPSNQ